MKKARQDTRLPYRELCVPGIISYPGMMRLKKRDALGQELVQRPGPKKFGEVDMIEFKKEVKIMEHKNKRTLKVKKLHTKWQRLISRRDINAVVKLYRDEAKRNKRAIKRQVEWHLPRSVWAMDDTMIDIEGISMNVHNVRDLASRNTFRPLVGSVPLGADVADNLRSLFNMHGAPIFLKRDNGSNLNSKEVDAVLAEYGVIALNSPTYYPPYNGGIEKCQRELKDHMHIMYERGAPNFQMMAEISANHLNHMCRKVLNGSYSCALMAQGLEEMKKYDMKKRKEIRDQIMAMVRQISGNIDGDESTDFDSIWRVAVETWLQQHGLVTVHKQKKCNPI